MSATKAAIKSLCPPLLWEFGHSLKLRLAPPGPSPVRYPAFEGPCGSWSDAVTRSDGWDAEAITARTFEAALKVRNGKAEFEQDTHVLEKIAYSPAILAFLALALSRGGERLVVVDFGGGLATNYYQNRKILRHLAGRSVDWRIVERPVFAELGREHFASGDLRFFADLDAGLEGMGGAPPAILFSGSLQYVGEPFVVLERVLAAHPTTLAFDRLLVAPHGEHEIYVQHPDPEFYYPATYPVWRFSKPRFVEHLRAHGYTLVEDFTLQPDQPFDHCGLVFVAAREPMESSA